MVEISPPVACGATAPESIAVVARAVLAMIGMAVSDAMRVLIDTAVFARAVIAVFEVTYTFMAVTDAAVTSIAV